jgi:type II secretory pathway predicted ATPase ExeA
MLTEVMQHYGLARPPIDAGFFESEHHAQVSRDIQAAITQGRLIALTAIIGSGKTILSRRLRAQLEEIFVPGVDVAEAILTGITHSDRRRRPADG